MKKLLLSIIMLSAFAGTYSQTQPDAKTMAALKKMMDASPDPMMRVKVVNGHIVDAPCPIDTLKGILIWHSKGEWNNGNVWDTAYWIGKCGPRGMETGNVRFIPGVFDFTQGVIRAGKKIQYEEHEHLNEGFRDGNFKPIPAIQVYGLIIIRK